MKTFFWGYFSLKWKRLFRTISIIIILFFSFILWDGFVNEREDEIIICLLVILTIPLLSYLTEPFVLDKNKKSQFTNPENHENSLERDYKEDYKDEIEDGEVNTKERLHQSNQQKEIENDKHYWIKKYFIYDDEYLPGISYLNRMFLGYFCLIFFGIGLLIMFSSIYKRSKSLGVNRNWSIFLCVLIPFLSLLSFGLRYQLNQNYEMSDDKFFQTIIILLLLHIPHGILLFKNGLKDRFGSYSKIKY